MTEEVQEYDVFIESLRKVLNTPEGKQVVWNILLMCSLYEYSVLPTDTELYHRLGRQSVGLEILQALDRVDEDTYPRLMLTMGDEEHG